MSKEILFDQKGDHPTKGGWGECIRQYLIGIVSSTEGLRAEDRTSQPEIGNRVARVKGRCPTKAKQMP